MGSLRYKKSGYFLTLLKPRSSSPLAKSLSEPLAGSGTGVRGSRLASPHWRGGQMVILLTWLFCAWVLCSQRMGYWREHVMDVVKDERLRAMAGSRSLSEVWVESFVFQVAVQTSAGSSTACRGPLAVLPAQ